jgi:hypothetical protein
MKSWKNSEIAEWIIILVIFVSATYPLEMIYLSETSLGKLFFIMTIIFFTIIDPVYGFVVCVAIITYYQMDLYRGFIELHKDTLFMENMQAITQPIVGNNMSTDPSLRDIANTLEGYRFGDAKIYEYTPPQSSQSPENKSELMSYFRNQHCDTSGNLMYKGVPVHYEMADHVFSELSFPSEKEKCNPCNSSCQFSVRETRLKEEESLVRPKSSNDEPIDWNKLIAIHIVAPINSISSDISAIGKTFAEYI